MELYIIIALLIIILIINFYLIFKKSNTICEDDIRKINKSLNESLSNMTTLISENVSEKNKNIMDKLIQSNNEIIKSLRLFEDNFSKFNKESIDFNMSLHDYLNTSFKDDIIKKFNDSIDEFKKNTKESISELEKILKDNLKEIRDDNLRRLEAIEKSVNERLETALEKRLKESFDNMVRQIASVNTTIGEIKTLAGDVSSLKRVLTNVKSKGIVGEVLLGNIIKEFLTSDQYVENFKVKKSSKSFVEYAIKLPGSNDENVYLPIDSKFPYEPYSKIVDAKSLEEADDARKILRNNLISYAKDVREKYIDVPKTTDFAIIFLPLEGLYLEALNMNLFEEIRNKYNVNITGPTTLSGFINSLQVGFKTLMIQKRSSEVFNVLANVKAEFKTFAGALKETQNRIDDASKYLDNLVGTRTRILDKKLDKIDTIGFESDKALEE